MASIYSFLKEDNKHKIVHINTVEEYFDLAISLLKEDNFIYRGINSDEQKYPKLLRYEDLSKNEFDYLKEFERYYGLYARVPNFWEFAALAQHHGLMTRLIDFTSNIFVATFFALHQKVKKQNYRVFVLDRKSFQDSNKWNKGVGLLSEPDDTMSDVLKDVFSLSNKYGSDYVLEPNYSNKRMFAQQGLFIIPGILTKEHIDTIYNKTQIEIVISGRIRQHILNRLKNLGYDEYRLMADLDSVCTEINSLHR